MSQPETRLGDLLIQRRLITASDLQEALEAQQQAPTYLPLGQLQANAVFETVAQANAANAVAPAGANPRAPAFDRRYNPSNTGHIRGASLFHITDSVDEAERQLQSFLTLWYGPTLVDQ